MRAGRQIGLTLLLAIGCSEPDLESVDVSALRWIPSTPGWGATSGGSYWNPQRDATLNSTESNVDLGGTWLYPNLQPPDVSTPVAETWRFNATPVPRCLHPTNVAGSTLELTLHGQKFRCFFPNDMATGIVALEQPASGNGDMFASGPNSSAVFVGGNGIGRCTTVLDPQGGTPINNVVRGVWALGRYLMTHANSTLSAHSLPTIKGFFVYGASFGGGSAVQTVLLGGHDPQFPVGGAIAFAGFEAQRYFTMDRLLKFTDNVWASPPQGPDQPGQVEEVFRTNISSLNGFGYGQIDHIGLARKYWNVPLWLISGDEDIAAHVDLDAKDMMQALGPNAGLFRAWKMERGAHLGDGVLQPITPNTNELTAGAPLDWCKVMSQFVKTQLLDSMGKFKVPPLRPPVDWVNDAPKVPTEHRRYDQVLAYDPTKTSTAPQLVTFVRRYGLGSNLGAHSSLLALPSTTPGAVDLLFGNLEGEVQRVRIDTAQRPTLLWTTKVGRGVFSLAITTAGHLFYATQDGRAGLLNPNDGRTIGTPKGSDYLGREPIHPIIGNAFDAHNQPVELIFVKNWAGEIIGLDPTTLAIRFRDRTVGVVRHWAFDLQRNAIWAAHQRGFLLHLKMILPGSQVQQLHISAPHLEDFHDLVTFQGRVFATGKKGTQAALDDQGQTFTPPYPGLFANMLRLAPDGVRGPDQVEMVPGTTIAMFRNGRDVGLIDLGRAIGSNTIVQPIVHSQADKPLLAMATHGNRWFATQSNGTLLELFPLPSGGVQVVRLNTTTAGAYSGALDPVRGKVVQYQSLEALGGGTTFTGALLEVDLTRASATVLQSRLEHVKQTRFEWKNGQGYLTREGTLVDPTGVNRILSPMSTLDVANTGGRLLAMTHRPLGHAQNSQVPIRLAVVDPTTVAFRNVTTQMAGLFNRGNAVKSVRRGGNIQAFVSTAGGLVYKFDFNLNNLLQPMVTKAPFDLGWKAVGLGLGRSQNQDVLFVGTWIDEASTQGRTHVLRQSDLTKIGQLDSGVGSWGFLHADLDDDGQPELIVGSFAHFSVYTRLDLATPQLVFRSAPKAAGYGAFDQIYLFDANGQPCPKAQCRAKRLLIGTTGGYELYELQ